MTDLHPYAAARAVLKILHEIFLQHGHRNWSVSAATDGKPNFAHIGLDEEAATKALRLLVTKHLAEHRGTKGFVISDRGVSTSDHPKTLDFALPVPAQVASEPPENDRGRVLRAGSSGLDQYVPGELRARFVAIDYIGGGSFGNVYQVVDQDSLRRFALKVTISAPDARARAQREAAAARALSHDNIMPVVEFGPEGQWFLFPLAEGTLGHLKSWGRLEPSAAFDIATGVGSALVHAHAAGFLHRDLHVDNILRFDGRWLVADWGLTIARGSDRLTRSRSVGGVQTWTAPEQILSLRNADERSDLFSLGRLVEWLATDTLPDPTRPGDLPDEHPLAEFVNATTRFDPAQRPGNVAEALSLLPSSSVASPFGSRGISVLAAARMPPPFTPAKIDALRKRHQERVEQIHSGRRAAVDLREGPGLILHLFPSTEARTLDLLALKQERFEALPPVAHLPWELHFNHDGLVAYWPDSLPATQQVQIHHNGAIELVDMYAVQRIQAPEPVLFPLNLERDVVAFVEHWTENVLRRLGVGKPFVVCLSITGVEGFELRVDGRPFFERKPLFDRNLISLRPVVVNEGDDLRRLLKATFDGLWQAAGEDRSLGYSPSGEWLESVHPQR